MSARSILVLLAFVLSLAATASAAEPAGRIKTVTGKATLISGQTKSPATVGATVAMGDVIETRDDGAVGITFRDASRVSLGASSRLVIDEFVFSPKTEDYGITTRLQQGTLFYVSGLIAKLAPQKTNVATPDGTSRAGAVRSGSANTTSKATSVAPASRSASTSCATRERGHGHCPTCARLSSSMSTIRTGAGR